MPASPAAQYPFPPHRPGDNRSNATRFLDDVRDLAPMASIALQVHDQVFVMAGLLPQRKINTHPLHREKVLREFQFMLMDIEERAELLEARCDFIAEMLSEE